MTLMKINTGVLAAALVAFALLMAGDLKTLVLQ